MRTTALVLIALLLMSTGCSRTHKERFTVSMKNETSKVVTIGFTKDNGPDQDIFLTPELMAMDPKVDSKTHSWGMPIAPGKTADTKEDIVAILEEGGSVFLRVYRGELNLNDILGTSRGSSNRLDIGLVPGKNNIVIVERDGRLAAIKK